MDPGFFKCNAVNFFLNITPILKTYLHLGLEKTTKRKVVYVNETEQARKFFLTEVGMIFSQLTN